MKTHSGKSASRPRANFPATKSWTSSAAVRLAVLLAGALGATGVFGGDWPQYRGPNHDGISTETIRTNWAAEPPKEVWKVNLGSAWSSFAVSGGRVFTQVRRLSEMKQREFCVALDSQTGQELWATSLDAAQYPEDSALWGQDGSVLGGLDEPQTFREADEGPRSTPSVDGDRVYVLTTFLRLVCLDSASGREQWSHDFIKTDGARNIPFYSGASPLVEGDLVLVNCNVPNQCLIALRKQDGTVAWQGRDDFRMTHSTPVMATIAGVRQAVWAVQSGLISIQPATGQVLWRFGISPYSDFEISPVVAADVVYYSASYGTGAAAAGVQASEGKLTAATRWRTYAKNRNHWATPVHHEGYLYGPFGYGNTLEDPNAYIGYLKCVDLKTGTIQWTQTGVKNGAVLMAGTNLLALTQDGVVVLIQPDPAAYRELGRFKAVKGICWNVPALSDGRLYVRSTSQAACFDLAPQTAPKLRLRSERTGPGESIRLRIGNDDGSLLDAKRQFRIRVLGAATPDSGTNGWRRLTYDPIYVDGELQVDDDDSLILPQRFYRTEEIP